MPGIKTSVWLGETEHAQWKQSGKSLTEIVKTGLAAGDQAAPDPVAEIRAAADELMAKVAGSLAHYIAKADETIRAAIREELAASSLTADEIDRIVAKHINRATSHT